MSVLKLKKSKRGDQAGFTLVEMVVVLAVIGGILYAATPLLGRIRHYQTMRNMAWQMGQVVRAAQAYVAPNEAAVEAATTNGTTTAVISVSTLQLAGTLWPSFVNSAPNGAQYVVIARRIAPGQLETLVTAVGGTALSDTDCSVLAKALGGDGGCVTAHSPNQVSGSGGWATALANFPNNPYSMPAGTPAAGTYYEGSNIVSPYLHRYVIGGQTEGQKMHAGIDMGANSIANATTIGATGDITTTAGKVSATVLYPSTAQTVGTACPLAGLIGQNSVDGQPIYCDLSTLLWKKPSATANFVIWY